jgi:Polyketide cyclase / dehydrase and lipid transport
MLLLRTDTDSSDLWTARADVRARAEDVLSALTDPALIAEWAPVNFDVDGLADGRLRAGTRERVSGSLAGVRTVFEVEVRSADTRRLELVAHGPVSLDVAYRFQEHDAGVVVEATVGVRPGGGLAARLLRAAVGALLDAGALGAALRRLEAALAAPAAPELIAA